MVQVGIMSLKNNNDNAVQAEKLAKKGYLVC